MPSKTLKTHPNRAFLWKDARGCSEAALSELARELAREIRPGDRVLLEGQMGAGKTTLARVLLEALQVRQPPEGSPSFAIAHEYELPGDAGQGVVHIDFYRIRDESEIEEAGLYSYFWDDSKIVLSEWLSSWPTFEARVLSSGRNWRIGIEFEDESLRHVKVECSGSGFAGGV